jgi:hypothetical protein
MSIIEAEKHRVVDNMAELINEFKEEIRWLHHQLTN